MPGAAAAWLENTEAKSIDSLARQISALAKLGIPVNNQVQQLLNARNKLSAGWGAYPNYQSSMPDTALALDALLTEKSIAVADSQLSYITGIKNTDGGWPYRKEASSTAQSALVPTAYGVLVLSNFVIARSSATSVAGTSITDGVNWLLALKKTDGGYAEDLDVNGVNTPSKPGHVFETSLVKSALSAAKLAGIAAANTTQANQALTQMDDFLVSRQSADGSFGGELLQTASVSQAQPATVLADTDHDGVPDAVEAFINGNANVADTRNLPKGNGDPAKPPVLAVAINDSADVPLPAWAVAAMGASMIGLARKRRKTSISVNTQSSALHDINRNNNT